MMYFFKNPDLLTHTCHFGEWICGFLLEESDHDIGIDLERQDRQKSRQGHISHHADERIVAYRNKSDKYGSKDDSGMDGIFPKVGLLKAHYKLHGDKQALKFTHETQLQEA